MTKGAKRTKLEKKKMKTLRNKKNAKKQGKKSWRMKTTQ